MILSLIIQILWVELLAKFFIGIASSLVFVLVILRMMKPKIIISDKICYQLDENDKKFYFFKAVNMSRYDAFSSEFELHRRVPYIVDKTKVNHRITKIELSKVQLYSIPRYKKEKGYGEHAILIRTFEDLSNDIDQENLEYVLYISSKHGLSNLTKVSKKSFEDSSVFYEGNFKFGTNRDTC